MRHTSSNNQIWSWSWWWPPSSPRRRIIKLLGTILVLVLFAHTVYFHIDHYPSCLVIEQDIWQNLTPDQFDKQFQIPRIPVLFKRAGHDWDQSQWTLDALKAKFPHVLFRYGGSPYPTRELHLDDMQFNEPSIPHLFQFGLAPATFTLGQTNRPCLPIRGLPHPYSRPMHDNGTIACQLLKEFHIPQIIHGAASIHFTGIFVSGSGAFTPEHRHHAAINVLLHGRKKWLLDQTCTIDQHPLDVVFIPEDMDHLCYTREFSVATQMQWHANHFGIGKNVGHVELDRMIMYGMQYTPAAAAPASNDKTT